MKRSILVGAAALAAAALTLTACGGGGDTGGSSSTSSGGESTAGGDSGGSDEAVTISLAGWSLATTPEFQVLADGFTKDHPNVTIDLVDYDATNYETQITADLAAGAAPDLYTVKQLMTFPTFQEGGQLLDVSDVAVDEGVQAKQYYEVDGKTWAIPYRSDVWYVYYNAELFAEAGIDVPTGEWTWEDFDATAKELTDKLAAAGKTDVKGVYQHNWQSLVQGFANAQAGEDGAFLAGEWDYMVPFYEDAVARQSDGSQVDFGAITSNSLTYQGQFGTQKAAMMPMGSWYVATYLAQRGTGDAETFEWGLAPVPQVSDATFDTPVTFGSPTAIGINPKIDEAKVDAAKEFLAYIASEDAAVELAKIGITPALTNDAVADAMFATDGMPADKLSRFAFMTHDTGLEVPLGSDSPALNNILKDAHSAIMSGSVTPEAGIADAIAKAQAEVLG